ncbi:MULTISPECIES: hypothetical protein [Alphaproteobacteria]|uniref:hypothetical protein n=1 Tax=Alphaproteobacteria TaxID=28211 RepID=UPI003A908CA8
MTLLKRRAFGSVHDAIDRALEEIQQVSGEKGIAAAAATLGCSQSLLYKASDPDMEGVELSLLRAGMLTEVYGIRALAEWLADKAGCDLAPREPAASPGFTRLLSALGRTVQDLADQHMSEEDIRHAQELIRLLQAQISTHDGARARQGLREVRS